MKFLAKAHEGNIKDVKNIGNLTDSIAIMTTVLNDIEAFGVNRGTDFTEG